MTKKKIFLTALVVLFVALFSINGFADDSQSCGVLHIQIANETDAPCKLMNQEVIHGNLKTSPPVSIMPDNSKKFDIEQTGFGPHVILEYECGDKLLKIDSKQKLCFLHSGNIITDVTPEKGEISARTDAFEGSFFWDRPGQLNWIIFSTASSE